MNNKQQEPTLNKKSNLKILSVVFGLIVLVLITLVIADLIKIFREDFSTVPVKMRFPGYEFRMLNEEPVEIIANFEEKGEIPEGFPRDLPIDYSRAKIEKSGDTYYCLAEFKDDDKEVISKWNSYFENNGWQVYSPDPEFGNMDSLYNISLIDAVRGDEYIAIKVGQADFVSSKNEGFRILPIIYEILD